MRGFLFLALVAGALFLGALSWAAGVVSGAEHGKGGAFNRHDAQAWLLVAVCVLIAMLAGRLLR